METSHRKGADKVLDRVIKCPTCKSDTTLSADNRFRPFCSSRCQTHDLAAWSSEAYSIQGPIATPQEVFEAMDQDSESMGH